MDKCPISYPDEDRENIRKELLDEYTPEYNITKIANEEAMTQSEAIKAACKAMESLAASLWSRR